MNGFKIPGCRDDWRSDHPPVLDAEDPDFYWPQNWPGKRSPCEWRLDQRSVRLWVEYADEPGVYYLDSMGARSVAEAIEADRELTAHRDEQLRELQRVRAYMGYAPRAKGSEEA